MSQLRYMQFLRLLDQARLRNTTQRERSNTTQTNKSNQQTMTIKGGDEPEINVSGKIPAAAQQEDIPVAFASVLDEKKPAAVASGYAVAGDTAGYEPTATPTVVQASTTQASPNNTVVQGAMVPYKPPAGRPVPPNAPPGGNWVQYKYAGNQTWGVITATGCGLFWCCAIVLAPCALFGLMCPCDEREGYMSPSGVIYDEQGRAVGDRRRNKFKVVSKA